MSHYAFSDGMYFSQDYEKALPQISKQKALIVYHDSVEHLTVTSQIEKKGSNLAWIIPVPSADVTFTEATRELLDNFSVLAKPIIVHSPIHSIYGFILIHFILISGVLFWIIEHFFYGRHRATFFYVGIFLNGYNGIWLIFIWQISENLQLVILGYVLIILLLSCVLSMGKYTRFSAVISWLFCIIVLAQMYSTEYLLTRTRGMGDDIVNMPLEIKRELVGAYGMTLLEAKAPSELNNWLEKEGFDALDADAQNIIQEYITEGWYFVCAKLDTTDNLIHSHPVTLKFKTDSPVYPMRLTSLSNVLMHLEIILFTDKTYHIPSLNMEMSKAITQTDINAFSKNTGKYNPYGMIGAGDEPWDSAYIAKYSGNLSPADMKQDFYLKRTWLPIKNGTKIYTHEKMIEMQVYLFCTMWVLAIPLWIMARYNSIQQSTDVRRKWKILISAFVFTILITLIFGWILPEYPYPVHPVD